MAIHGQAMRTGKTGRTSAKHGNGFSGLCSSFKRMNARRDDPVGRKALQTPDFNGLAFGLFTHARLFTQGFCWANSGTHSTKNILRQDCFGRGFWRACCNLPDEQRNINVSGTGGNTRCIMTEIASIGCNQRFVIIQSGMQVGKIILIALWRQTARGDT